MTNRLGKKKTRNPPDLWIRAHNTFTPIVDRRLFEQAGQRLANDRARRHMSDEELLRGLKTLLDEHGFLSCPLIDESNNLPSSNFCQTRFGGVLRAYRLIGYTPNRDYHYVDDLPAQKELLLTIVDTAILEIKRRGGTVVQNPVTQSLTVNHEFTARIGIVRCQERTKGCLRWEVRFDGRSEPDVRIAVRLNSRNDEIQDYYIIPRVEIRVSHLRLAEHNDISIEKYRSDTLEPFYQMAARHQLECT
jgi:hypothetical protein